MLGIKKSIAFKDTLQSILPMTGLIDLMILFVVMPMKRQTSMGFI
jgi:hypothetical protein